MKKLVTALFFAGISIPALSSELPQKATFELSKIYSMAANPEQYNSYNKRVQNIRDTKKSTDSLSKALGSICERGLKLVNDITPLLLESKDYSYQSDYEFSYANPLDLSPEYSNYDVECIFRGHKADNAESKVKVTYSEKLRIYAKTASISTIVKF